MQIFNKQVFEFYIKVQKANKVQIILLYLLHQYLKLFFVLFIENLHSNYYDHINCHLFIFKQFFAIYEFI
jgi:hypothetical protein